MTLFYTDETPELAKHRIPARKLIPELVKTQVPVQKLNTGTCRNLSSGSKIRRLKLYHFIDLYGEKYGKFRLCRIISLQA